MTRLLVAPGDRSVPWLDAFPKAWRLKPVKYVCSINRRALPETTDPDTEFRYLDISGVDSEGNWVASDPLRFGEAPSRARRVVKDGDVLVSTVRTYLRAIAHIDKVDDPLICSTGFAVLSANGDVQSKFLAYWARSAYFVDEVVARSVGVSYPAVNASDVGNIPCPRLPLDEQRAISAFLDRETARIDVLIERKRRQIELLHEKRAALISHAVTRGLDPKVPLKDSGVAWLGEIPVRWEVKRLKYMFKNMDYKRVPLSAEERSYMEKRFPYYGASGIIDFVENYIFDEPLILIAEDGANLLSRSTPLAFIADGKYWVNNHAHILKPMYGRLRYWEAVLQTYDYTPLISGAAQPKLTAENLSIIPLPRPPEGEQISIAAFLDCETGRINALAKKLEESIATLREYRTSLITAAVTGKIDIRKDVLGPSDAWLDGGA